MNAQIGRDENSIYPTRQTEKYLVEFPTRIGKDTLLVNSKNGNKNYEHSLIWINLK